jgi:hypothetical protein
MVVVVMVVVVNVQRAWFTRRATPKGLAMNCFPRATGGLQRLSAIKQASSMLLGPDKSISCRDWQSD